PVMIELTDTRAGAEAPALVQSLVVIVIEAKLLRLAGLGFGLGLVSLLRLLGFLRSLVFILIFVVIVECRLLLFLRLVVGRLLRLLGLLRLLVLILVVIVVIKRRLLLLFLLRRIVIIVIKRRFLFLLGLAASAQAVTLVVFVIFGSITTDEFHTLQVF